MTSGTAYRGAPWAFARRWTFLNSSGIVALAMPAAASPQRMPCRRVLRSGRVVARCLRHLSDAAGADCMAHGCLARRAYPVGGDHAQRRRPGGLPLRVFLQAQLTTPPGAQ
jgi:hypothetical protein